MGVTAKNRLIVAVESKPVVKIVEQADVGENAEALWREIGQFGAVARWHPLLAAVESEGERAGCRRVPEGRDGSLQTERLLEMAPARHFYRYRIEETPLPIRDWTVELRVEDRGSEASTVVWSAELQPTCDAASTVATVRDFMRAGLDQLRASHGD